MPRPFWAPSFAWGPPLDKCWPWAGGIGGLGYTDIYYNSDTILYNSIWQHTYYIVVSPFRIPLLRFKDIRCMTGMLEKMHAYMRYIMYRIYIIWWRRCRESVSVHSDYAWCLYLTIRGLPLLLLDYSDKMPIYY